VRVTTGNTENGVGLIQNTSAGYYRTITPWNGQGYDLNYQCSYYFRSDYAEFVYAAERNDGYMLRCVPNVP
jgi:hypothetical protein